jgi:hypothetical protein
MILMEFCSSIGQGRVPAGLDISPSVTGDVVPLCVLDDWLAKERGVDVPDIMAESREQLDAVRSA